MAKSLVELTVEIIQGQTSKKQMTTEEIANALKDTFQALKSLQDSEVSSGIEPDTLETNKFIDPKKSIQRNKVVCLECGQEFKMLSGRHLASHGLDSKTYRKKYGFTARQPLCAKSLSVRGTICWGQGTRDSGEPTEGYSRSDQENKYG